MQSNIKKIWDDFPILQRQINGVPLVYLDNAATTQKPRPVIDTMTRYYEQTNANIHRGIHTLAEEATEQYEGARKKIAAFIGAKDPAEIVFVRNVTEGINLIARTLPFERSRELLLTEMEHHSNLVPWFQLPVTVSYLSVTSDGTLDLSNLDELLDGVHFVSIIHASNVLGTVNDVKKIIDAAHRVGAKVLIDAAQSVPHMPVNVQELGCDFLVFSGHKMYGPTGIGVLWGRRELLEAMPPFLGGGDMIRSVRYDGFEPNELPWKFEAGTPHIAGAIGLGAAADYMQSVGIDVIQKHEQELTTYALEQLAKIQDLVIYGPTTMSLRSRLGGRSNLTDSVIQNEVRDLLGIATPRQGGARDDSERAPVISFNLNGIHAHDLATLLDREGIAIRSGHHCAEPLVRKFGQTAMARVSFGMYNTKEEVDALVVALEKAQRLFE